MGKGTILVIGAVAALILVIYLSKKAQEKKKSTTDKNETQEKPKQQKSEALIVKELMEKGYNETEAQQIASSQLYASGWAV